MWNNIKINNDDYMISVIRKDDAIKIILTNLIKIWVETLTNEIILDKCRKLNPLLNVEALNHTEIVSNILNDISKYIVEGSVEEIKLKSKVEGGLMKFNLNLSKGSDEDFWENITKPLCISGREIIRRHKFLLNLVKQKDQEIAEYKAEGAELIRKNIETEVFTEEQFKTNIFNFDNIDHADAFQGMMNFYNEFNSSEQNKISTEPTSNGNDNTIVSDQDNNAHLSKNEDAKECTKPKLQKKTSVRKKVTKPKTGTANIAFKPVKKLKKDFLI